MSVPISQQHRVPPVEAGQSDSEPVLMVRDLGVTFPARRGHSAVAAVDVVDLDIPAGTTLGLVGESGSGKTTTGRAILQLLPSSGSVRLLGRELGGMRPGELRGMRRHMQFVLQNPYSSLHPRMTVEGILAEPLRVHRTVPASGIDARVDELLDLVGLDAEVRRRYPHEFSGGQRQRIVIARALAVDPDFVVCDEPVSALDVRIQAQIVELLTSLQQRLGVSYLFIAHDLAVVQQIADRVAVMYAGRIVELGDVADVYARPRHPYTRILLDAVPVPDPDVQRARLAAPPVQADLRSAPEPEGECVFGRNHREDGSPEWHLFDGGHGASCRYWPAGVRPDDTRA
ncbi:ABC transporter ATP-binding protein [Nakamurella lactea]|uniref:ABC transporter ATP-binding protein n=1 Tax=Nakamurella lactea TaxID=459515 RepID=UPI0003FF8A22|nr:ATP-binding cassette domain-containing protein [Nakamurella lactea]